MKNSNKILSKMDKIKNALIGSKFITKEIDDRLYIYVPLYPNHPMNNSIIQKLVLKPVGSTIHIYGGQGYRLEECYFNINDKTTNESIINAINIIIEKLLPEHKECKSSILIINRSEIHS